MINFCSPSSFVWARWGCSAVVFFSSLNGGMTPAEMFPLFVPRFGSSLRASHCCLRRTRARTSLYACLFGVFRIVWLMEWVPQISFMRFPECLHCIDWVSPGLTVICFVILRLLSSCNFLFRSVWFRTRPRRSCGLMLAIPAPGQISHRLMRFCSRPSS